MKPSIPALLAFCVLFVLLLSACDFPVAPRQPEIKDFAVVPNAVCIFQPHTIHAQWTTSGDYTELSVLDSTGNRASGPFRFGSDGSYDLNVRDANLRAGLYDVQLEAKFNTGGAKSESKQVALVDRNGVLFPVMLPGGECSAEGGCDAIGPDSWNIDPSIITEDVTFSEIELTSFGASFSDVKLRQYGVFKPPTSGGVALCNGEDQCSRTPIRQRVFPEWSQSPQGEYQFSGFLNRRVQKGTTHITSVGFLFVCRQ